LDKAYPYPEIRPAGTTEFFEYIEKNFAAQLPTLSGELNNFSGDYSSIDPDSQGWKGRECLRNITDSRLLNQVFGSDSP
jgi:hypothetical protein